MPRRTAYLPGAPCWIDRISAHLPGAEQFYSKLFGWTFADDGGYRIALLDGEIVAGFGSAPTPREFWTVYLAAKDLDATVARVQGLGGKVLMAPITAGDNGSLFLASDPAGTLVGFWAGSRAEGVVLVDQRGTACRYELHVPDVAGAADFYGGLFGYELSGGDGPVTLDLDGVPHVQVVEDTAVAPHWLILFGVDDSIECVRQAISCGASVIDRRDDGSLAIQDPWGARFGVCQVR